MKQIRELTEAINILEHTGDLSTVITGLTLDSRAVTPGMLFAAIRGTSTDGHRFIPQAVAGGASVILCEVIPDPVPGGTVFLKVNNVADAIGPLASAYYDYPSHSLKVVGVTGTNGKTTIVSLLWQLFENLGFPSGLLSTIRVRVHDRSDEATHTTPDPVSIQKYLSEMVMAGCSYAFMEVSSHALDQGRVKGIRFAGGIFTNLTRDHLDYHLDFQSYLKAKKSFFDSLPDDAFAIINSEDRNGPVMLQNTRAHKYSYSSRGAADFEARLSEQHLDGMNLRMDGTEVWTRFVGRYNVSNLLAVYAAARLLGCGKDEILKELSRLKPVEGRLETVSLGNNRIAIVDYAHTPDALENVLKTLQDLKKGNSQIITVFGAGGDRDKGKRPQMAEIACRYSDRVIVTSDNPRTEDPDSIISDILKGVPADKSHAVLSIENRREAIKTAAAFARTGDIILVAGKGHETYQDIQGVKHHFDDREELSKLIINK
ncbi:MAG: UDP-N-acetylmuramoyl-L-alanyl-D-glutamate--2,6-diaminopimelate ligase [Bacteroidota bacterium]